jgi:hypothetical protein
MSFARIVYGLKNKTDKSIIPFIDRGVFKPTNEFPKIDTTNILSVGLLYDAFQSHKVRKANKIHPSEFSESCCDRKLFYSLSGIKPTDVAMAKPSPTLQRIFDMGTFIHLYIQVTLHKMGILKQHEADVENAYFIGSADAVINLGKDMLLEIKTINSFGFSKLAKPKDDHKKQANIYANILRLDEICFLYYNKDTSELKEFFIPADTEMYAKDEARAWKIFAGVKKKVSPDRICADKYSDRALRCDYCSYCFK